MKVLIDTNVLLRTFRPASPQHDLASATLKEIGAAGHHLIVVAQVVYELWAVATRPLAQNGLAFSAGRTAAEVAEITRIYPVYYDDELVFHTWLELVVQHAVLGKNAHDARLVAAMLRHGVTHLLTFNAQDFTRFPEITAVLPQAAGSLRAAGE